MNSFTLIRSVYTLPNFQLAFGRYISWLTFYILILMLHLKNTVALIALPLAFFASRHHQ